MSDVLESSHFLSELFVHSSTFLSLHFIFRRLQQDTEYKSVFGCGNELEHFFGLHLVVFFLMFLFVYSLSQARLIEHLGKFVFSSLF